MLGGIVGILLALADRRGAERFAGVPAVVQPAIVALAAGFAAAVGIFFGYYAGPQGGESHPDRRAALRIEATMRLCSLTPVVALILALAGLAAPARAAAGGLTLEEARERALARSIPLQKALLSVDSAALAQKTRFHDLLPTLSVSAGASVGYPTQTGVAGSGSVSASQTFYDGGRYRILAAIDRLDSEAAREQARAAWFTAVETVESAYYTALEAAANVEAARGDLEAAALHEELARAQLEIGTITRSAYLKTESEKASKETALSQARRSLAVAGAKLASLTGLAPLAAPLELAGVDSDSTEALAARLAALSAAATADLLAKLSQAASSRGPTIAAAALAADKAARQTRLAARDAWPRVSASWSHGLSLTEADGLDDRGGTVALSLSLPLNTWTTRASVDSAGIEARQAAPRPGRHAHLRRAGDRGGALRRDRRGPRPLVVEQGPGVRPQRLRGRARALAASPPRRPRSSPTPWPS